MGVLAVQSITESGKVVTYSAAEGGGSVVENDGSVFLHLKNGSGGELTVTITAQTTTVDSSLYGDLTKANATQAIAASGEAFIGPFPPSAYNNTSSQIAVSYSGVTSLTVAALRLG